MHTRPSGTVEQLRAAVAHHRQGDVADPAHRGAVDERVELGQRHRRARARARPSCSAAPAGSTPTSGSPGACRAARSRTPASSPPPPTGTTTTSGRPAELVQDLDADRALAGDRARGRRTPAPPSRRCARRTRRPRRPRRRTCRRRRRARPRRRRAPRSARASAAGSCAARARGRGSRARGRRRRRPGRGCRRSRTPRRPPARRPELGEQVVGAAQLVRAPDLQVLALEPHLGPRGADNRGLGSRGVTPRDPVEAGRRCRALVGEGRHTPILPRPGPTPRIGECDRTPIGVDGHPAQREC